ncbi:MAG: hypothetical protein ACFBZ8_11270 [Opitutales bacterium]
MDAINKYKNKGDDAWKLGHPCSGFACSAWEAGTGESLNSNWGPVSNPTTLKNSITEANGGVSHNTATSQNNTGSTPSSSSHSSGSSVTSCGSSLQ